MKVATWWIPDIETHVGAVLAWIRTAAPHVVCLQGSRPGGRAFPFTALYDEGYYTKIHGSAEAPGPALLGLEPLQDVERIVLADGTRRLSAHVAGIRVVTCDGLTAAALGAWERMADRVPVLVAGPSDQEAAAWHEDAERLGLVHLHDGEPQADVLLATPALAARCRACAVVPVAGPPRDPLVATFGGVDAQARPPGVLPGEPV